MVHLALVATGGTIATRASAAGRAVALDAAALLSTATVPDGATVTALDAASGLSFAAGLDDLAALAATVHRLAGEHDGVVVTHGTDTLEETAFLLALTARGPAPVTVTGAQRPADHPAADGPGNLSAALAWVASAAAAGSGTGTVTVTFDGTVWPAVGVRKVHTADLAAVAAPGRGPVGHVDEDGAVRAVRAVASAAAARLGAPPERLPRVDVVAQYVGADAHAVHAAREAGARGLVIAGFGAGNATPAVVDAARDLLDAGVPVAVASRTGSGPVSGLYAGGGADLARAGALFLGDLSPWQARLLLATAIAVAPDDPAAAAVAWCRAVGVLPEPTTGDPGRVDPGP